MNEEQVKFINDATEIFAKTKFCQQEQDKECLDEQINKLAVNMIVLERLGLGELNKKLISNSRKPYKVSDFIAEHNFAIQLHKQNSDIPITYEPQYLSKPPDFVINKNGVTFWLQMKRLSNGERDNRQDKIFEEIKDKLIEIKTPKFVSIFLSDDFKEEDIGPLIAIIKKKSKKRNQKFYRFQYYKCKCKANFCFKNPKRKTLDNLILVSFGDFEFLESTGLDANQIKNSMYKASSAFKWDTDLTNVNLIVMEADNKDDHDFCEACFGTEFNFYRDGKIYWSRKEDGFFNIPAYNSKVAGVIAVRRKESKPITLEYTNTLFINERYLHRVPEIQQLISIDNIIRFNEPIS